MVCRSYHGRSRAPRGRIGGAARTGTAAWRPAQLGAGCPARGGDFLACFAPMRAPICSVLTLVFLTACSKDAPTASPTNGGEAAQVPADVQYGVDWLVASIDREVDPCQDFYAYACGGWAAATERPADKARYSRAFSGIQDRNYATLRTMLEAWSTGEVDKGYEALAGQLYGACMDEEGANARGITGLAESIAAIEAMKTTEDFMATVGSLHATVFAHPSWLSGARRPLFNIDVDADFTEDPDTNISHVAQGGLGLPSRELYLDDNDGAKKVREVYEAHIANMLGLSGVSGEAAMRERRGGTASVDASRRNAPASGRPARVARAVARGSGGRRKASSTSERWLTLLENMRRTTR